MVVAATLAVAAVWAIALPASAHPLGNTSVNIYERVEIGRDDIRVRFVMDVSELPALDEKRFADTNDDGAVDDQEAQTYLDGFWGYLEPKLELTVAGAAVRLERTTESLTFPPGQGGLTLMRVVFDLVGTHPGVEPNVPVDATLTETTFEGVPGWHEIVVRASKGGSIVQSDVPAEDLSDELTVYPEDRLDDPLGVRVASFTYTIAPGGAEPSSPPPAGTPPIATPAPSVDPARPPGDPLVDLVTGDMTAGAALVAVLVALGLGAVHAASPGHGKTLVAAYVVGTSASIPQALWLGLTVAVTHTAGVLLLAIGTWFAAEWFAPDLLVRWLGVATGVLILGMGAVLVWRGWLTRTHARVHDGDDPHTHDHGHPHPHPHAHGGSGRLDLRTRDVAALGIVGGLVPSGSALILLLSSITLGQLALGVVLIVAFGVGMALVLVGIAAGVVLVRRTSFARGPRWRDPRMARLAGALPVLAGLGVVALGAILTWDALRKLG